MDYENYYRAGLYEKVRRDRFDSLSEKKVCMMLHRFMRRYDMDRLMDLRLSSQQPLDNYVVYSGDERFADFYLNRHKWMRFDFIFEKVYEWHDEMRFEPVCVVEFDGPYHEDEKQKELDAYKNGVASNIGAVMVRISCSDLQNGDINHLLDVYEEELLSGIVKGYFTKTKNYRQADMLINEASIKQFEFISDIYTREITKASQVKKEAYMKMLQTLYFAKETMFVSSN